MKRIFLFTYCFWAAFTLSHAQKSNLFPDGTRIPNWFSETAKVKLENLGTPYNILDHGAVNDSTVLQTETLQKIIDKANGKGGGVIIIPKGTFLSGALFFKPKTHLFLAEGTVLKGSDNIRDYPKIRSRME